jgi:hypothetical protein
MEKYESLVLEILYIETDDIIITSGDMDPGDEEF